MRARPVHGALDELFDFDRDGELDCGEEALKFDYIDRMARTNGKGYDDEDDEDEDDDFESDDYDSDEEDW